MLLCSVGILRAVEYTVITSWVWWLTRMHRWCIVGTVFELVLCCFHWCHLLPCLPSCLRTTLTLSSSVTYSLRSPACSQCSSSLRTSFSAKRCVDDNALYLYLLDCEVSLISYACLLHFVWAVAEAKCVVVTAVYVCVCLSLAAFQHYCTDPDVSWQNGRGCPVVLQYWVDLQSVHGFCCYGNIAPNAECQLVLVFAVCLVNTGASEENLWEKWCRIYISVKALKETQSTDPSQWPGVILSSFTTGLLRYGMLESQHKGTSACSLSQYHICKQPHRLAVKIEAHIHCVSKKFPPCNCL